MYLKKIKASGFKSFADKIELDINGGITCIVGPNGSGKSNVVDAVRWVLGEQSVKSLRGTGTMSDIIFTGSKTRSPLSRASVSLIFDNSDHYLKSEFSEIEIKRVVYRTGENEYYINNSKVRLKDILELFMDSGASKESFNIISQGSVENIVDSKPEARRVIFEEASGVLKYKKHKEESLRKLEKTNENLEKVDLLIDELNVSLEPLREQSEVAKKYLEYKSDLENIEVSLITADINNIHEEYNKLKVRSDEIKVLLEEVELKSNKDVAKLETLKLSSIKLEEIINSKNDKLISLEKEIADTNAKKQLISERKKYEVSDAKLQDNIMLLKESLLSIDKNIVTLENELKNLNEDYKKNKDNLDSIDNKLFNIKRNKMTLNNEYNIKNKDLLDIQNKIDILKNNIENDTKLPLAVKSVLNNPRLKGIHKTISKLIDMDDSYVTAIDISLGTNSNVIVVDNEVSAKNAINYLKDNKLGRATFFPLSIIKGRSVDDNTLDILNKCDGYIDIACNLVKFDSKYDNVIKNLLGNVVIVDNIDNLNNIAKKINYKYKVVSIDGDVSLTGGALVGGTLKSKSNINDKYELSNLEKKYSTFEGEIRLLHNNLDKVNDEEKELSLKSEELSRKVFDFKESINRKNISLNDLKKQYKDKNEELDGTKSVSKNALDKELDDVLNKLYKLNTDRDLLVQELNKDKSEYSDIKTEIASLENASRRSNGEYNKLQQEANKIEIDLGKMDVKMDNYLLTLNEDYNMTYEKAVSIVDVDIDISTARLQVNKLKSLIKGLGDVNVGSIQEFERVNTRYTFLSEQKDDLIKSTENLLKAISEMDDIMREKFRETFDLINKEFSLVFNKLFRGGEAHLELTNPDDLLETGIDIVAEPPGKKLNSIVALSGGERTLTAIALLFAILNVKIVPFVILDEVEAALDEANVDVFGKYLQSRKEKSQFIIITHKKRTMEYADTLYGITMQEQGVSKLVSVKLED